MFLTGVVAKPRARGETFFPFFFQSFNALDSSACLLYPHISNIVMNDCEFDVEDLTTFLATRRMFYDDLASIDGINVSIPRRILTKPS